jgi:polyhydroxybutyrate depolymerase
MGSVTRSYIVHVPPGYTGSAPVPLVLDFHPLSVEAKTWKSVTGWAKSADDHGFILVVPDGYQKSWNVGRCCDPALSAGIDDVAFVRAMVTKLSSEACIDPKRVYASGCSNGGGMSYRLACDAADVFAAVAPVDFDCLTGPTNTPSCASCNPSRPISEAQFRATGDPFVPYDGGPTTVVAGIVFPGAEANLADWGSRNKCTGTPQPEQKAGCETYPTCAAGVETTLCTVQGGSHCSNYGAFGIVDVAWDMFTRHTLP